MLPTMVYQKQSRKIPGNLAFARYSLRFNGIDHCVRVAGGSGIGAGGEVTVSARIKRDGIDSSPYPEIFGNRDWDFAGGIRFWISANRLTFDVGNGTARAGAQSDPLNWDSDRWYYLLGNWNGTHIKVERDGIVLREAAFSGDLAPGNHDLFVGTHLALVHFLGGRIKDVMVYKRTLSPDESQWNMFNYHNPVREGLDLWLPMEEGAGEIVYDKSGHGNNGTLLPAEAGPTWERLRQWELRAAVE